MRDHPRLRGKDFSEYWCQLSEPGSPPLARERPPLYMYPVLKQRITPACAGKTVLDPSILAILLLSLFKIYLISLQVV